MPSHSSAETGTHGNGGRLAPGEAVGNLGTEEIVREARAAGRKLGMSGTPADGNTDGGQSILRKSLRRSYMFRQSQPAVYYHVLPELIIVLVLELLQTWHQDKKCVQITFAAMCRPTAWHEKMVGCVLIRHSSKQCKPIATCHGTTCRT